ncbi:MAG: exodeoxyribonuclease V subunit gamma, partial [Smithellaceae bacterium]|nr:exodeoxyribonuclease V subunit gamma [Smithellaceae bacterium]
MPGLHLYYGNRIENLTDRLALLLRVPLASPLQQEIILIQGMGMEKWISLELARHSGICANVRFLFPRVFISGLFSRLNVKEQSYAHFSPTVETWRILNLIAQPSPDAGEELKGYLGGFSSGARNPAGATHERSRPSWLKPLQLAERLAATFDKYLLFRPEIIRSWEGSERGAGEGDWQARLWRDLFPAGVKNSPLSSRVAFSRCLKENGPDFFNLPSRLSLVNITSLPEFYLDIFLELSLYLDVSLFFVNPSAQYWGDILSEREIGRKLNIIRERRPGMNVDVADLYLEQGNRLLASLGQTARDFFASLMGLDADFYDLSEDPGARNLLECIQQDLYHLRDRGNNDEAKTAIGEGDFSLQVHSCHSPLREIEVLHDRLLSLLEQIDGLKPKDILVVTSDIDAYAPLIDAVFSSPLDHPGEAREAGGIPYAIAGRRPHAGGLLASYLMKILALAGGRYEASGCFELLEASPIRERFDLTEEEVDDIRRWVIQTRIQWGKDGKNKGDLGLPPIYENTWQAGLDRLLLGYALMGDEKQLFQGILPCDWIEGDRAATVGKLAEFLDVLFRKTSDMGQEKTLSAWSEVLLGLLDIFRVRTEDDHDELSYLTKVIRGLAVTEKETSFHRPLDFSALMYHLEKSLSEGSGFGFFTGGLTFSSFLPMRGIPFRVICLLGMNYAAFPGQSPRFGFDLTAQKPKPGDPSRRNEDRYLFLEAIICARDCLYLSYVGQSAEDNSVIPPSAVVSELLDYIDQGFAPQTESRVTGGDGTGDWMVTKHPLQAYHPSYFQTDAGDRRPKIPGLFSYSRENCHAARALMADLREDFDFIGGELSFPPDEYATITIDEFAGFFRNPVKYFLQKRLGIYLGDSEGVITGRESFELAGLDRYQTDQRILELLLASGDEGDQEGFQFIRATGLLPQGTMGEVEYHNRRQEVENFVRRLRFYLKNPSCPPLSVNLLQEGVLIRGELDNLHESYCLKHVFRKTQGRDLLGTWICHVIMNAFLQAEEGKRGMAGLARKTLLVDRDRVWEYPPLEDPETILRGLLEWYRDGLRFPLKLF